MNIYTFPIEIWQLIFNQSNTMSQIRLSQVCQYFNTYLHRRYHFKLAHKIIDQEDKVIKFINELKHNYEEYSHEREIGYGEFHGTTPCVQYGHYDGEFLIHVKDDTDYYADFDLSSDMDFPEPIGLNEENILDFLDPLFNYKVEYIFDYKDLRFDVVGQTITYLLIHNGTKKQLFCKVSLFDNLSVNRWDIDNMSCDIFLSITYSDKLSDLVNDKL